MNKLVPFALFAISALLVQSVRAQAISLGNIIEVRTDDGGLYKQLPVNCGLRTARRYLRKDSEEGLWCDSIVDGFCANRPVLAAEIVCSRRYFAALQKHKSQSKENELNSGNVLPQTANSPAKRSNDLSTNSNRETSPAGLATGLSSTIKEPAQPKLTSADNATSLFQQKNKLELLKELRTVEQELLDIQSARLTLRERDLELMRQQLRERQ